MKKATKNALDKKRADAAIAEIKEITGINDINQAYEALRSNKGANKEWPALGSLYKRIFETTNTGGATQLATVINRVHPGLINAPAKKAGGQGVLKMKGETPEGGEPASKASPKNKKSALTEEQKEARTLVDTWFTSIGGKNGWRDFMRMELEQTFAERHDSAMESVKTEVEKLLKLHTDNDYGANIMNRLDAITSQPYTAPPDNRPLVIKDGSKEMAQRIVAELKKVGMDPDGDIARSGFVSRVGEIVFEGVVQQGERDMRSAFDMAMDAAESARGKGAEKRYDAINKYIDESGIGDIHKAYNELAETLEEFISGSEYGSESEADTDSENGFRMVPTEGMSMGQE